MYNYISQYLQNKRKRSYDAISVKSLIVLYSIKQPAKYKYNTT
jgi:hypothetical protein